MVEREIKVYEDSRGSYAVHKGDKGTMPLISVSAKTIPEAWELAMLSCWDYGTRVGTHYDNTSDTPKSKEATISVRVENPFNEPRIHKNFPGGPEELEAYRQEVMDGIHDHWMDPLDPNKWKYTYHERLFNYNPSTNLCAENRGLLLPEGVNQIEKIVYDLAHQDITSRGSQATTWMPTADPGLEHDRPCLQRLWFRVLEDENNEFVLNLNSHWRSRDLSKAWFMNVYAITDLQRKVADDLSREIGKPIKVGSYNDISDSLHVYGDYFKEIESEFEKMRDPDMSKRVWASDHPAFKMMTEDARAKLAEDPDCYAKGDIKKK